MGKKHRDDMRKELLIDEERLSDPSKWPKGELGMPQCHLKTWWDRPQRFGMVYGDDPLAVWQFDPTTMKYANEPKRYPDIKTLVDEWMID